MSLVMNNINLQMSFGFLDQFYNFLIVEKSWKMNVYDRNSLFG